MGVFQELEADAVALIAVDDHLIEPIHDESAVIGRGGDEGELARRIRHGGRVRRRTRKQGSRIGGESAVTDWQSMAGAGSIGLTLSGWHPCDQGRFLRPHSYFLVRPRA